MSFMSDEADPSGISDGFLRFLREFVRESDRAAVVLDAAMLDSQLLSILSKHLLPSATDHDDLLRGGGPLSNFSSRITMARRLGLIDSELAHALSLIRRIRNDFAHRIEAGTLTACPHKDRVSELTRPLKAGKLMALDEQTITQPYSRFTGAITGTAVATGESAVVGK